MSIEGEITLVPVLSWMVHRVVWGKIIQCTYVCIVSNVRLIVGASVSTGETIKGDTKQRQENTQRQKVENKKYET